MSKNRSGQEGLTLVEMMAAVMILSVVALGTIGSFAGIQKSIHASKLRAQATNQAQEKIQILKQTAYHHLAVTDVVATDPMAGDHDPSHYPPETIQESDLVFRRFTLIQKARENNGAVQTLPASAADTGLKQITVTILWKQGGDQRKLRLSSLFANPDLHLENGALTGDVKDGATSLPLVNAAVVLAENSSLSAFTNAAGRYVLTAPPGNYTVRVSAPGYGTVVRQESVSGAMTRTAHFALNALQKGTVRGTAYVTDHLVLSEICAASTGGGDADKNEYVEIYNPTPEPVSLNGMRLNGVNDHDHESVMAVLPNVILPKYQYYLVAHQNAPVSKDFAFQGGQDRLKAGERGGVVLRSATDEIIDRVAWTRPTGLGLPAEAPSNAREGVKGVVLTGLLGGEGLLTNEIIERKARRLSDAASMAGAEAGDGNAWDADNNETDWVHHLAFPVRMNPQGLNSPAEERKSGTPASGGFLSVNDGLSTTAPIDAVGRFQVNNVAVNLMDAANTPIPWKIVAFAPAHSRASAPLAFTQGTAPNFTWDVPNIIYLDEETQSGFIAGRATDMMGLPIADPAVRLRANGNEYAADENGAFFLSVPAGACTLEVNPTASAYYNPRYVAETRTLTLGTGEFKQNVDFTLSMGFRLDGRALKGTSNDPLPFVRVEARRGGAGGALAGQAITDGQGNFAIANLPVGFAYDVRPSVAHAGERSDPDSQSVVSTLATQPQVQLGAPFRISTSMGRLQGRVTKGGAPVKAGVVVLASREMLTGSPVAFPALKATEPNPNYYFATVLEDGSYSMSILGGPSASPLAYHVYAFVPGPVGLTSVQAAGPIDVVAGTLSPYVANLPLP